MKMPTTWPVVYQDSISIRQYCFDIRTNLVSEDGNSTIKSRQEQCLCTSA